MSKASLTGSATILLVSDVQAAAKYYQEALGFSRTEFWGEPPCFCMAHRDGLIIMLQELPEGEKAVPNWKRVEKSWNVYFWVDDVEALYEEMKASGAKIDYDLCVQPYGCKEFGIQDLDGYDIAFGEVIED